MDKEIFIRACRDGGRALQDAIRRLDREYGAALFRECRRIVRDAATAHDLVQDTFIRVWQRCASFHGDSGLMAWMRAILRHAILDDFRRREPLLAMDDPMLSAAAEQRVAELSAQFVPTPQDEACDSESAATFARCWERFERECPSHAAVIAWIAQDGLDHEAIAQLLGRSPGATREYISQCRKKARACLAEWYELAFGSARK